MKGDSTTDVHISTFQNNIKIEHLDLSTNLLNVIYSNTFQYNINLNFSSSRNNNTSDIIETGILSGINPTYLDLSGNKIRYLDNSAFRKQGQLLALNLSENMLQCIGSDIFTDCSNLCTLSLSTNNISDISRSAFYGLEHLEHLDLSNNIAQVIKPVLFEFLSISTNRKYQQVSKLKHLNLAQNKIRSFNFKSYFPSSTNSGTSDTTYKLVSLYVSSNLLNSLEAASMRWLKHTAAVMDLSGNSWKSDRCALGEAWRELRHKLTLNCSSPEDRTGCTWDVIGDLCTDRIRSMEPTARDKLNMSSDVMTNITTDTGPALVSTLIVVNGVLVACTIVGGCFTVVHLLKELRKGSEVQEHNEVSVAPWCTCLQARA